MLYAQASDVARVAGVTRDIGDVLRSRHRSASLYRVENLTGLVAAARRITAFLVVEPAKPCLDCELASRRP